MVPCSGGEGLIPQNECCLPSWWLTGCFELAPSKSHPYSPALLTTFLYKAPCEYWVALSQPHKNYKILIFIEDDIPSDVSTIEQHAALWVSSARFTKRPPASHAGCLGCHQERESYPGLLELRAPSLEQLGLSRPFSSECNMGLLIPLWVVMSSAGLLEAPPSRCVVVLRQHGPWFQQLCLSHCPEHGKKSWSNGQVEKPFIWFRFFV